MYVSAWFRVSNDDCVSISAHIDKIFRDSLSVLLVFEWML